MFISAPIKEALRLTGTFLALGIFQIGGITLAVAASSELKGFVVKIIAAYTAFVFMYWAVEVIKCFRVEQSILTIKPPDD